MLGAASDGETDALMLEKCSRSCVNANAIATLVLRTQAESPAEVRWVLLPKSRAEKKGSDFSCLHLSCGMVQ